MSNPTELLNCPFCGGTPSLLLDEDNCSYISCDPCSVAMPAYRPGFEQNAIQAWNRRAQPEGEAPQAELVELLKAIRPNYGDVGSRDIDVTAQRKRIDRAIELLSDPAATLSPLCGAQHAESGKEVAVPGWEQRVNAVAPALRVKTKEQAMEAEIAGWRALAAQQAAAPGAKPAQEQASTTHVTETKRAQLEARGYEVVGYVMQNSVNELCTLAHGRVEWLGKGTTSAPGTPEAPKGGV